MKFPHPPILCLHRVRVPTPETMTPEVQQAILGPFIEASKNTEGHHMCDHCGFPRPPYEVMEPTGEQDKVTMFKGRVVERDFSHCPLIEAMYYATYGILGSETDLYREFEDFPAMVYVATQKEEFRKEVIREASPNSSQGMEIPERQGKEKEKRAEAKEG